MKTVITLAWLVLLSTGWMFSLKGQEALTAADKQAVIDSLAGRLESRYVFPDVARRMAADLRQRLAAGEYRSFTDAQAFADRLTADLQAISHDKHLNVRVDPGMAENLRRPRGPGDGGPPSHFLESMRRSNYGFQTVKILDGNVGYLDLRGFMDPSEAGETAAAAMNLLSNADAIIFDLRYNGGGSPGMIQLLTSYLYPAGEQVHLNSFYYRPSNDTSQTWTLPYVPGRRNPKAEVFVLTSKRTFSAAEEFTYNLKNLKRGTIIGETTGGGAHPGGMVPLAGPYVVFLPTGRAINPVTKTNWEGTGVEPDVQVPAEEALGKAHLLALEKLQAGAAADDQRQFYDWHAANVRARQEPVSVPAAKLERYAGSYGMRSLIYDNGRLYLERTGRYKLELMALAEDTFTPVDQPYLRVKVEMEQDRPVALTVRYDDGGSDRFERDRAKP